MWLYLQSLPQTGKKSKPVEPAQQGVGLKMAAHPLLLDTSIPAPQSKKDRYKPMQPKFASIKVSRCCARSWLNFDRYPKANTRNAPTPPPVPTNVQASIDTANPYASGSAAAANDKGFEGTPKERSGRSFRFNQKGKYVQIGNQMRQQQQLEQLKQRIAESARKAGLDAEFETLEKNIKVRSHHHFISTIFTQSYASSSAKSHLRPNGGISHCFPTILITTLREASSN